MACFIAPAVEAIVTTAVSKAVKTKETEGGAHSEASAKIPFSRKLGWLSNMLWGGSTLLAFEHVWHGEVVPFPPFLTAMYSAADTAVVLKEIATTGVTMAALVTAAWCGMLAVSHIAEKRAEKIAVAENN